MTDPRPAAPVRFPHPKLPDAAYRLTTVVLRVGLAASLAILLAALVAYLLANPGETSAAAVSSNPIVQYLTFGGLAHGLAVGAPDAFLTLGIFVLIAAPITRVVVGIYYFRQGHEREMTAITAAVLVLLLVGLLVLGPYIR
jgi:uncharacterized membrane protein